MTAQVIPARFALRRRTAAAWAALNEVLQKGEPGVEIDTGFRKSGNGVTAWNDLDYELSGHMDMTGLADGKCMAWDAARGLWAPANRGAVYMPGVGIDIDDSNPEEPVISSTLGSISIDSWVSTYAGLPSPPPTGLTTYLVSSDGRIYVWNGSAWPASGKGIQAGRTTYASVVPGAANFSTVSGTGLVLASQISTVEADDDGLWDAINKRFVVALAGVYSLTAQFRTVAAATLNPYIRVNGRYVSISPAPQSFDHSTFVTVKLAAGDVVELWFYHVGSVALLGTSDTDFGAVQRFNILGPL